MTRPRERLRGAASATFAVYLVQALLAIAPAWPLARAVERAVRGLPTGTSALAAPGGLWRMEALAALGSSGRVLLDVTVATLLLGLALGPLLQMTWLAALLRPRPLRDALAQGARHYLPAFAITLALAPLLLLALVALVTGPALAGHLVDATPSDRTHDLATLAGYAPALLLAALWALWHDLARASLARGARPLAALVRGALACARPSALPAYLLWLGIGASLAISAQLFGGALDGGGFAMSAAVLAITQSISLTRTFVRGRWLADALDRVR